MKTRLLILLFLGLGVFVVGAFLTDAPVQARVGCGSVPTGGRYSIGDWSFPIMQPCYCSDGYYCARQPSSSCSEAACCPNGTYLSVDRQYCLCPAGQAWVGNRCDTIVNCPQQRSISVIDSTGVYIADYGLVFGSSITTYVLFQGSCTSPQYLFELYYDSNTDNTFDESEKIQTVDWQTSNTAVLNLPYRGKYEIRYTVGAPGQISPLTYFSFRKVTGGVNVSNIVVSPGGVAASATFSWAYSGPWDWLGLVLDGRLVQLMGGTSGSTTVTDLELGRDYNHWFFKVITGSEEGRLPGPSFTTPARPANQGINRLATGSWFQVKDADVQANGLLTSNIPQTCTAANRCTPEFDLPGDYTRGYPGIPGHSGASNFGTTGRVSARGWDVQSGYSGRRYDYQFFKGRLGRVSPADRVIYTDTDPDFSIAPDGSLTIDAGVLDRKAGGSGDSPKFLVHRRSGDLTITNTGNVNFGSKGLVVFADGNVNIQGKIRFNPSQAQNQGFFAVFAGGNINIAPGVYQSGQNQPALEGIFLTNGTFNTGSETDPTADRQLYIRGMVAGLTTVNLQRNLDPGRTTGGNNATPAEFVEYAPELALRFPKELLREVSVWREIAP